MRFPIFATTIAAVLCLSLVGGVGTIAAQEESNETETELGDRDLENLTVSDLEGVGEVAEDDGYVQEVDSGLRIVAWEYHDGKFSVTFESDESKSVTMSEWVRMEEGSGQGAMRQHRIPEGTSTVSIEASRVQGDAAISITTSQSVREGRYSYLSTGQAGMSIFNGAATWGLAGVGGLSAGLGTFWGTKRYIEKQDDDADEMRVEEL